MQNLLSTLAISLIDVYRRYLSHRKGYCCAHHRIRGEGTCSSFGRKVFLKHTPLVAMRLLRRRLRECSSIYEESVSRMSRSQLEAHWHARQFLLSPHRAWIERWRMRHAH
jgi:putative component of membrane protein insertase Oxa1/YidC/SpoIIIJ protein YidD